MKLGVHRVCSAARRPPATCFRASSGQGRKDRHTEEQIIAILKEHEAATRTADLCRKHGSAKRASTTGKAWYGWLEPGGAFGINGARLVVGHELNHAWPDFKRNVRRSKALAGLEGVEIDVAYVSEIEMQQHLSIDVIFRVLGDTVPVVEH